MPTVLAVPKDARLGRLAQSVIADPRRGLDALCRDAGVSARTLQRIFRREVGMDFETWRRQVRLMKAVELLAEGRSIKSVAHAIGYRQASTFVAMFRRALGADAQGLDLVAQGRRLMPGLYFEEFSVGQSFTHPIRRTVTEADNVFFSALTHNPAQLHLDEEYAKGTEFGTRIVNSLFTLGLMIGISVGDTTLGHDRRQSRHGRGSLPPSPSSTATRCTWRARCSSCAPANRAPARASSCSATRRSTSAERSSPIANAARSMLGSRDRRLKVRKQREAARNLARMGGTQPDIKAPPRRRL